jgi:hypothetical protein
MMIIGVYATLGMFLLIASRNPSAYKGLIWFTVWSSVVHAAIMGIQAFNDPAERGHLVGDVPAPCDHTCSVDAPDRTSFRVTALDPVLARLRTWRLPANINRDPGLWDIVS